MEKSDSEIISKFLCGMRCIWGQINWDDASSNEACATDGNIGVDSEA